MMSSGTLYDDLWHAVLEHIVLDDENIGYRDERKNMETLLNVALTNSTLSDIALSKLWRNLQTLRPIVSVINSSPSGRLLYYDGYWSEELGDFRYWVLEMPDDVREIGLRVQEYLRRVRVFSVVDSSRTGTELWCAVARFLDNSEPILPCLRQFSLSAQECYLQQSIGPLISLFPNSLSTVYMTAVVSDGKSAEFAEAILTFYRMLASRGVELENLSYYGDVSDELLLVFGSFRTMQTLVITHERKIATRRNATSISDLITQLPSLRTLRLDYRTVAPPVKPSLDHFALREIELQLYPEDFLASSSPLGRFTCPNLQNITLVIHYTHRLSSWAAVFEQFVRVFPYAEAVDIRFEGGASECPRMHLRDIEALLLERILHLQLQVPYNLTTDDLTVLIKAWPDIRCFTLSGPGPSFDTAALSALSQMSHLECLSIRVDCMDLITSPIDALPKPQNVLTELRLVYPIWTSTLQSARILARKLRLLFPKMWKIDAEGAIIVDLSEAVAALH